ncbi:hypothetical protein LTR95_007585 [Oleoguttula sp. CCFEE 5521]
MEALKRALKEEQRAGMERFQDQPKEVNAKIEVQRKETRERLTAEAQEIRSRPGWVLDTETLRRTAQDILENHQDRTLVCQYCKEAAEDRRVHYRRAGESHPPESIFYSVAEFEAHIVESTAVTDGEHHEKLKIAGGRYDVVPAEPDREESEK